MPDPYSVPRNYWLAELVTVGLADAEENQDAQISPHLTSLLFVPNLSSSAFRPSLL